MKEKFKKALIVGVITLFSFCALQGCSGEDAGTVLNTVKEKTAKNYLSSMKEFKNADETMSIYLNKDWREETNEDYLFIAGNVLGTQQIAMMQIPKSGVNASASISNLDDLKNLVSDSYLFEGDEAEAPEMAGAENVTAWMGKITGDDEVVVDSYIVYGETDYAYYTFIFAASNMKDDFIEEAKASCETFKEDAPEEEDNTTAEISDTIRWFNASYAILTVMNKWDYNRFGGLAANDTSMAVVKEMLDEWWSVTDRASADETLDWILSEGHRTEFALNIDDMVSFGIGDIDKADRTAYIMENFEMEEDMALFYANMFDMYEEYGENAIDGWDYCRALNLVSFYYIAGYYTEQEALDKSLEIAQIIQPLFTSWDDLVESYMRGYEYWAEESADERRSIYEDLKTRTDNPYAVDYNVALEKTW